MQGSIAALQPRMVDGHARVTGDLCAIVRVPPLVHTRLVIGSARLSLSLSPLSIPYVPTSIDKSISLPSPARRRSNLLGKYYSKNRKVQTRSKRSDISLSLLDEISLRGQKLVCLSISRLARFSRVFKNPRIVFRPRENLDGKNGTNR